MSRRRTPGMVPLAGVFAVNGALYGSLLPRFPQVAAQIGVSTSAFGLGLAGLGVGGVLGAFAATKAVRAMGGPLRTLQVTGTGVLLAGVLAGASPTLLIFTAALVILGLCDGFMDTAMNQLGAALRRSVGSSVMGTLHASLSVATLVGTGVGAGAAALDVPVGLHMGIVAVLLAVVLFAGVAALRNTAANTGEVTSESGSNATSDDQDKGGTSIDDRKEPGNGRVGMWLILLVAGFAAVLIELPAQEWSGLLLARELSASAFIAGLGPFVAVGGVTVSRLALDPMVDRFGWRRVARASGVLSIVGTLGGLIAGATLQSAGLLLIGLGIAALGAGVAAPLLFDHASGLALQVGLPAEAGPGLISGVFRLGVLGSPLLVAAIVQVSGLFIALGVTAVAGLLIFVLARPLTSGPQR